jgi:hypothetical protein
MSADYVPVDLARVAHHRSSLTRLGTFGNPLGELLQAVMRISAHSLLHLRELPVQGLLLLWAYDVIG